MLARLRRRKIGMGFLSGKNLLITGLLNKRSIAYGVAKAAQREGASLAFAYQNERVRGSVESLAAQLSCSIVLPCDVSSDAQIAALFAALRTRWQSLDGLLHAIAYAAPGAIDGDFVAGLSRAGFLQAHDISAYSFAALAKEALPMMEGRRAALLTLSYLGAERAVPHYNTMGLAKASLEAAVRYLSASLGPRGIRVNAISAGPLKTVAAASVGGVGRLLRFVRENAPLRRNVTADDVGNAAAFLLSDLASGITGEVVHVDAGFSRVMAGVAAA